MTIKVLKRRGMPIKAIARETGVSRNTVKKYLQTDTLPRYQRGEEPVSLIPLSPISNNMLSR